MVYRRVGCRKYFNQMFRNWIISMQLSKLWQIHNSMSLQFISVVPSPSNFMLTIINDRTLSYLNDNCESIICHLLACVQHFPIYRSSISRLRCSIHELHWQKRRLKVFSACCIRKPLHRSVTFNICLSANVRLFPAQVFIKYHSIICHSASWFNLYVFVFNSHCFTFYSLVVCP